MSIKYGWTSDNVQVYCLHCGLMLSWSLIILIEITKNAKKKFQVKFLRLYCQSAHAPILKSSAVLSAKRVITGAKRHTSRAKAAPGQANRLTQPKVNKSRHQNTHFFVLAILERVCQVTKFHVVPLDDSIHILTMHGLSVASKHPKRLLAFDSATS